MITLSEKEIEELTKFLDWHLSDDCGYDFSVPIIGSILHKLGWKSSIEKLKETIKDLY